MESQPAVGNDRIRAQLTQIFRYIQALEQLRNPPQNEIEDQRWVMWLHDLPEYPRIHRGAVDVQSDDNGNSDAEDAGDNFILKVARPHLVDAPKPPLEIMPWLLDGWQRIDGKINVRVAIDQLQNGRTISIRFQDNPQRVQALDAWTARRNQWVTNELPAYRTMQIYERLFELLPVIERESERVELMLGDGLLHWRDVHYPILLVPVQIQFNPNIPEFTIIETGQTSELYTALFQTLPEAPASEIARCREDHEQGLWHPLSGEETTSFFRRMISQLSPHGEVYQDGNVPQNTVTPYIVRDPVLFLRPRNLGLSTALTTILNTLPTSTELPEALMRLVQINEDLQPVAQEELNNHNFSSSSTSINLDTTNGEDDWILLSKPANAEQLEIARRLEHEAAVLVQGPPGTGKTHTIANLIGHLLAQGKSILVTSEKPKALRVLKEKVVEPLQPLCVSILGDDSRREMEKTIDTISERLSHSDANVLEREAGKLANYRLQILAQLRDTRSKLIEARSSEYRAISIAGETYNPSEAARFVTQQRERAGWIPGPVIAGAPLPLSMNELSDLYRSNTILTAEEEQQAGLILPDAQKLPPPIEFAQLTAKQNELKSTNLVYRHDLWINTTAHISSSNTTLDYIQQRLLQEIEPLKNLTSWHLAAISAGREGGIHRQVWDDLVQEIEHVYLYAAEAQLLLVKYDPFVPQDCLPNRIESILDEIIAYVQNGGKFSSLRLMINRDWKTLLDHATVQGKRPEILEHFQSLRYFSHLRSARDSLIGRWQRQMSAFGEIGISNLDSSPEKKLYQYANALRIDLQWYKDTWEPLENALKQQGFLWERFVADLPDNNMLYGDILRLRTAIIEMLPQILTCETNRRHYSRIDSFFTSLIVSLDQVGSDGRRAEVVHHTRSAIQKRDLQAYRTAYETIQTLQTKTQILHLRLTLLSRLEKVAPAWANAIMGRSGVHGSAAPPGNPIDAWKWRQLNDELDSRTKASLEELQDRIAQLSRELYRVTGELVEKKAWAAQVRHTTLVQQRALQTWRELMRKVGKGKGKRVPRLLAEARKLMPECQSAVPVWIMPLSLVARNFDMKHNSFDVVILDEASQADITALIAIYLGKQVLVVGDDEQVSPLAVGQLIDEIDRLADEHLRGIPSASIYDRKLSIYSLARTTFTPVCLLEHFRCVTPIIQFSNKLSYHGKIKPLRDDSEISRRPATIAFSVKSFTKDGKVNKEEAYAVASLLMATAEQPEYKDATFGVISMLAGEQALYIEQLLRRYMPPIEYMHHQVLCGDSAQFQGDERDVMFLSMVDVPSEKDGPLSLRDGEGHDGMFKKRFNVAASRARDQMWVIHSLDPEIDLKSGDLRRLLITHARDQHAQNEAVQAEEQKIESIFEKQVFDRLVRAGYRVKTQWPVGAYRIDMVVEGGNKRLAIECDGDRWHTQENLVEDMARQAILERLGWRFFRIRGSQFFRNPDTAMGAVFARLSTLGISPEGMAIESNTNSDGKALKDRIIQRAYSLRREWEASHERPEQSGASNGVSAFTKVEIKQTVAQFKSPSASMASTTPLVTKAKPAEENHQKVVFTPTPSQNLGSNGSAFNLVIYLANKRLKVIDKRPSGGCLWVIGGNELRPIMNELRAKNIIFIYAPNGGEATGNQAAWYTKG